MYRCFTEEPTHASKSKKQKQEHAWYYQRHSMKRLGSMHCAHLDMTASYSQPALHAQTSWMVGPVPACSDMQYLYPAPGKECREQVWAQHILGHALSLRGRRQDKPQPSTPWKIKICKISCQYMCSHMHCEGNASNKGSDASTRIHTCICRKHVQAMQAMITPRQWM